jgi:hypothetical protein
LPSESAVDCVARTVVCSARQCSPVRRERLPSRQTATLSALFMDTHVHNCKKKISDQTVKTFNAVLAMARKTSELAPAFAVTLMPAMVDCRKWATARSSRDDLGQYGQV